MSASGHSSSNWLPAKNWLIFILLTLVLLWVLHALAFFPHEYAHSFTAWLLGWKTNPLALHYGGLNAGNLLAQFDIDENVDYAPIFAGNHGVQATLIAAAGVAVGNGLISYALARWGYQKARQQQSRTWALFFYWLYTASVGNFIAYVPLRTFTNRGDMHTFAQGLQCSPWWIIVILGIPFIIALVYFLGWFMPQALNWLFPYSAARRAVMVMLTALAVFGFYGAAGWSGHGKASHLMSVVCVCGLLPLTVLLEWWLIRRLRKQ